MNISKYFLFLFLPGIETVACNELELLLLYYFMTSGVQRDTQTLTMKDE